MLDKSRKDHTFLVMGEAKSIRERFYDSVHKEPGESGHWIWLGRRMEDEWGPRLIFDLGKNRPGDNRIVIASRFAYEDVHGVSLKGQKLKRLCSSKMCVNPAHFTPWLNAKTDRKKLLQLATTGEERAQQRDAQRRQEKQAPYLAMHWAKGIAKELVRQRGLLAALVATNQKLIAELTLSRAALDVAERKFARPEPGDAQRPATPLVDVFLSFVSGASALAADEPTLAHVLDKAIELRIDDEGGMRAAIDLFRAWLGRFSNECADGAREPTAYAFVEAASDYASSVFGSVVADGSNTLPTS